MRANRENGGANFRGILVEELICRHNSYAELSGFTQNGFNAAPIGNEVLDLIAVEGEERPFLPREQRILQGSEDKASQGKRLLSQTAFREIHDHPLALIHRLPDRKR